jgi:hypothetical protein
VNLEELKRTHPNVFEDAKRVGIERERDRVTAHLEAGSKVGDLSSALAAVRSGAEFNPEIMLRYMSAGRNRADIRARQADSDVVETAILNVKRPSSAHTDSHERAVLDRFEALIGNRSIEERNIEDR